MNSPLRAEARAYAELQTRLMETYGLDKDDETLRDTLEGCTQLKEMIVSALRYAERRKAYAAAIGEIIKDNQERKARHERANESIRTAVALAMQDAGLPSVESDSGDISVSFRQGKPRPMIVDEALVRTSLMKVKYTADKSLINAEYEKAMRDGEDFDEPGIIVTNGDIGIVVRTK